MSVLYITLAQRGSFSDYHVGPEVAQPSVFHVRTFIEVRYPTGAAG